MCPIQGRLDTQGFSAVSTFYKQLQGPVKGFVLDAVDTAPPRPQQSPVSGRSGSESQPESAPHLSLKPRGGDPLENTQSLLHVQPQAQAGFLTETWLSQELRMATLFDKYRFSKKFGRT